MKILIQRALVEAVTRNSWWGSLEQRIKDFSIKYCQKLTLDRTEMKKPIEYEFRRVVDRRDSLVVELPGGTLSRVSYEVVKIDAHVRQEGSSVGMLKVSFPRKGTDFVWIGRSIPLVFSEPLRSFVGPAARGGLQLFNWFSLPSDGWSS